MVGYNYGMEEYRRHFRFKEFLDVAWKLLDHEGISGQGTVVNISASGLLLQADQPFQLSDDSVLFIEPSNAQPLPFAPKKGKVMWSRGIHTPQERLQCGVEFLPDKKDAHFKDWLAKKMDLLNEVGDVKILSNMVA